MENTLITDNDITKDIFTIVLNDLMFGYPTHHSIEDYQLLREAIARLTTRNLPIKFFLPAFPCKSPNKKSKVFGIRPDFGEFLALKNILGALRKIEAIYDHGVEFHLLSDYHTFDQYLGVSAKDYQVYHASLKKMIYDVGGDDIIKLLSLASYREFSGMNSSLLSQCLKDNFGDPNFKLEFDARLKADKIFLAKYQGLRRFLEFDQAHRWEGGRPGSKTNQRLLSEIARGIMEQGVALDNFLSQIHNSENFIRLSIHKHAPSTGKFCVNLFKAECPDLVFPVTPWHNVVCFDAQQGTFSVSTRDTFENLTGEKSSLLNVKKDGHDWLYIMVSKDEAFHDLDLKRGLDVKMVKGGCGMVIQNLEPGVSLECVEKSSITALIKEFGLVVMRGFEKIHSEEEFLKFYMKRNENGLVRFNFGYIHKVKPSKSEPGYVFSNKSIPIHFDLMLTPPYMAIDQNKHSYEDFIPREFVLYCWETGLSDDGGETTFVDCRGVALALQGRQRERFRKIQLSYESNMKPGNAKEAYFGGRSNCKEYPLVMNCPWTGHQVLRWHQLWTDEEHPSTTQVASYRVTSSSDWKPTAKELEAKVKKVALDQRFFFGHSYDEGDLVFVNNYTMLHGRNKFGEGGRRELWRLQALPPSDNLPEYLNSYRGGA